MRTIVRVLSVFLWVSVVVSLEAASERADRVERTFAAAAGGRMEIQADRGSITVEGRAGQEVTVEVHRKVTRGSDSAAASLLDRHQVRFSEQDGVIRLETELEDGNRWNWRGPRLEVDIRVQVPREFDLQAETAGGSVRVAQVAGDISIRTSGGSLGLESVAGKVQARTSGGSIRATSVSGQVDLHTSGGSIDVKGAAGDRLKATTSGGSIHLSELAVPVEAKTSGGSINLETSAAPVDASTSGGSVSARFSRAPGDDVSLRTSGGGVTVTLPSDSAFDLDASTSAGSVSSEFAVAVQDQAKKERGAMHGPVNGGGPLLKLRTSAGGIRIRKS